MLPGLGIKGVVAGREVIIGNRNWMQAQGMEIPKTLESQANTDEGRRDDRRLFWLGRAG